MARAVYGDARLWFRLADANGLTGGPTDILGEGLTLALPNLDSGANSVDTFRPYDPSAVNGHLDAVLPDLPMPQDQGGGGCGAMGNIIMLAVTLVVAYYTGQAATSWLGSATGGGMSAGAAAVVGGAAGGAAGSIAGQVTGNALGVAHGFSWNQVAMGAIGGGVAGGLSTVPAFSGSATTLGSSIARGAIGSAITQGVAVVTGLQDHFDWTSVAASAVGAGVGYGVNAAIGNSFGGDTAGRFAKGLVSGLVSGAAVNAMRGGKVSIQQIAVDAFGQAVGQSFVDMMQPTQGVGAYSDAGYTNWMDQASDSYNPAFAGDYVNGMDLASDNYNPAGEYGYRNGSDIQSDMAYSARRDQEWITQSDAIQNRRLEEFTLARGDAALVAMRDADIDAQARAQSNTAARRNNSNYGHEGRGSVVPAISAFTRFMSNPSGGGMPTAQQEALELMRNMPRPSALEQLTAAARNQYDGPVMKAYDPIADRVAAEQRRYDQNTIGLIAGGVLGVPGIAARGYGAPEPVVEVLTELTAGVGLTSVGGGFRPQALRPALVPEGWTPNSVYATELHSFASSVEPATTPVLRSIAEANGGNMLGLQYNLKTVESLNRKIDNEPHRIVNDALRYTISFGESEFTGGVQKTMNSLESLGYEQIALSNTFKLGRPYLGINSTYLTPEGQMFELQFHTPASFQMKDVVNHPLYEQQRVLERTDPVWKELERQMVQNSSSVPIPQGVPKIKSRR